VLIFLVDHGARDMRRHYGWGCNEKRNFWRAEEKVNHRYSKANMVGNPKPMTSLIFFTFMHQLS
jgi:hypothetical protein